MTLATEWLMAWTSSTYGKREQERRAAVIARGLVDALRRREVSLDEARQDLFNLDTYQAFKRRRLDRRLIEMLEWALELPTVARHTPEALDESLTRIERLAGSVLTKPTARRQTRRPKQKS